MNTFIYSPKIFRTHVLGRLPPVIEELNDRFLKPRFVGVVQVCRQLFEAGGANHHAVPMLARQPRVMVEPPVCRLRYRHLTFRIMLSKQKLQVLCKHYKNVHEFLFIYKKCHFKFNLLLTNSVEVFLLPVPIPVDLVPANSVEPSHREFFVNILTRQANRKKKLHGVVSPKLFCQSIQSIPVPAGGDRFLLVLLELILPGEYPAS